MPKKSPNGNTLTANILELMYKLKDKNMIAEFESDIKVKYKKSPGYEKMFSVFNNMIENDVSAIEPNPSDEDLADKLELSLATFNDKKQDYYDRILAFVVGKRTALETWEEKALKILQEVDALWDLGLRKHAEARFLKLHKLCSENVTNEENKLRYSYLLSKINYYAYSFRFFDYLGKKEKHEQILNNDQFALIGDLERASNSIDASTRRYAEPEKWQQESAEFKVFQVMALLAKNKYNYQLAVEFTRNQLTHYEDSKMKALLPSHSSEQHRFQYYDDNSPQEATEIHFAFYYYLKMEEYHLALLANHPTSAEHILQELYSILNQTSEKSRHYLTGLLLYLQLDLQQAQFALMLKGGKQNEQLSAFSNHFLATSQEVVNMDARMEINRLLIEFFSRLEKPDFISFEQTVKTLEGKLKMKAMSSIKMELHLLQLFICLESINPESKDQYLKLVSNTAKESKRETDLLNEFLKGIRKIKFTDPPHLKSELPKLASTLDKHRNPKKHIDNIIMYWLNQFPIVRNNKE